MWPFIKSKKKEGSKEFKNKYFVNDKLSDKPKYDLGTLYERCVEEMTLQQAKRDQVFTLYLAMFSFLVPFALSTEGIGYVAKGVIFIALAIIGWMFALIIERYRIYKESYWLCCQTLTNFMSFKEGSLDKKTVQAVYFRCLAKKGEKYIDKEKKKYRRVKFYKGNIFSGETIYYLIHSFITAGMVYLGIYQTFFTNPFISAIYLHTVAIITALLVFIILTIFYFEKLLEVYSVLLEDTSDAFNIAFSKAWFLHFYVEKSPYEFATVDDTSGEVLKGEIPNMKTFVHHIEEGEYIESTGIENYSRIFIVAKGAITVNNEHTLYEKGICAFLPEDSVIIKANSDVTLLEINVKGNMEEADKEKLPYFLNYADAETYKEDCKSEKTTSRFLLKHRILPNIAIGSVQTTGPDAVEEHEHPFVEQLFYSFSENNCNLIINGEKVHFDKNTLFHIPIASKHGVNIPEKGTAHYVWIDYILDKKGLEYMDEAHQL